MRNRIYKLEINSKRDKNSQQGLANFRPLLTAKAKFALPIWLLLNQTYSFVRFKSVISKGLSLRIISMSCSTRCVVGSLRSHSSSRCVMPTICKNSTLPFGVSMPPSTGSGAKATLSSSSFVFRHQYELVWTRQSRPEQAYKQIKTEVKFCRAVG